VSGGCIASWSRHTQCQNQANRSLSMWSWMTLHQVNHAAGRPSNLSSSPNQQDLFLDWSEMDVRSERIKQHPHIFSWLSQTASSSTAGLQRQHEPCATQPTSHFGRWRGALGWYPKPPVWCAHMSFSRTMCSSVAVAFFFGFVIFLYLICVLIGCTLVPFGSFTWFLLTFSLFHDIKSSFSFPKHNFRVA
jgi:hypothetical protein